MTEKIEYNVTLDEVDQDISAAEKNLAELKILRAYVISKAKGVISTKSAPRLKTDMFAGTSAGDDEDLGVTSFVREFLNGKTRVKTKVVIDGYAKSIKVAPASVGALVSKTLSRLKTKGELINVTKPGAKRASGIWTKVK